MVDAVGGGRTAIRLAPFTTFLDAVDDDPVALGTYMTDQACRLSRRGASCELLQWQLPGGIS